MLNPRFWVQMVVRMKSHLRPRLLVALRAQPRLEAVIFHIFLQSLVFAKSVALLMVWVGVSN